MRFKQVRPAEYADDGSIKKSGLVQASNESARGLLIHVDNVDFISPIDGSHIHNSRELVDHNKKHGVSNDLDSLREQTERAGNKNHLSRRERKDAINDAMHRVSSSGFSRREQYE